MRQVERTQKNPKNLIGLFITGSLAVLLLCLVGTALSFSMTFLSKEKLRASISLDQLQHAFDYEYRPISEEMWTHSYDAIVMRIAGIAKQLGHASYDLFLADESGQCVYSTTSEGKADTACETPQPAKERIAAGPSISNALPSLKFDMTSNRYVYVVPLFVGAVPKGYLYTSISDPYEFFHGNSFSFAISVFLIPVLFILLAWVAWLLASKRLILKPYLSSLVEMEKKEAIAELAAQVAHDIRAPLVTARSVIRKLKGVDQGQLKLLNTAHSRMENIANELIDVYITSSRVESPRFCFVSATVDSIVAEKTAMLGDDSRIEIATSIENSASAIGVPISTSDFSRVLSNLLNNAIEACRDKTSGKIAVNVASAASGVRVSVSDNGKGMSEEVLHKICTVGGSFGRVGGAGLGLQHAKATVGKAHGNLNIRSALGKGTVVTMEVPTATPPAWFSQSLTLGTQDRVVILDDDESVHLLWKDKLEGYELIHLRDPEEFDANLYPRESCRYIFDYEITGSSVTGLDLIASNGLGERAVLVTSYFNEPQIQSRAEKMGTKILPKFMMCDVEIRAPRSAPLQAPEAGQADNPDLILIDDDLMVHDLWHFSAKDSGRKLLAVATLDDLDTNAIDPATPIYVDKNFKKGPSGIEVARALHERGFSSLYLATGSYVKPEDTPHFIRRVVGKDFPLLN